MKREMGKKPPLGSGERFEDIEEKARESGARDPAAVAAAAGRKKYGKKKMAELAARGRARKSVVIETSSADAKGQTVLSEYDRERITRHNFLHDLWGEEGAKTDYFKPKVPRTGSGAEYIKKLHADLHRGLLSKPGSFRLFKTQGDLDKTLPPALGAAFLICTARQEADNRAAAEAPMERSLISLIDVFSPLAKSGRGNIEALRDWVGRVGFAEAVPKVARALGISEERAKRIVGKLKGMANRAGTLRKEHSYDPEERAEAKAKARKSLSIVAYY